MIDLSHQNEWQYRDESTGLIFPWYTKPCLDEIVKWDLKDKVVFEYGCGASTLWWAKKCRQNFGVENNLVYTYELYLKLRAYSIHYGETEMDYLKSIERHKIVFDIIIVDGDPVQWRDNCVNAALVYLKPGGKLIIDNWDQPSVWVPSEETRQLVTKFPYTIYKQPNHPDWQTAVFTKC